MIQPTEIAVHTRSRTLEIAFDDGSRHVLPAEYLRVFSPSAEVVGHAPGQEVLQYGKRDVGLADVQPAGNYALRITFTDGHDTGLYSWDYLAQLGREHEERWAQYLRDLEAADLSRDPEDPRCVEADRRAREAKKHSCASCR